MISIIIPVYNQAKKLNQTLKSIASQSYVDFEIIIIDDGSTQKIEPVVNKFNLPKLRLYKIAHGGANKARQYGFELSSGEYIIFWDADIVGRANMLETMLTTLRQHPGASYAYSSYIFGFKRFKIWPFSPAKLRKMPYIHTTSLIRYKHFPGWDQAVNRLQDWDLWLTMLELGYQGIYIPKYLFRVKAGGSMSAWLPKYAYRQPFKRFLPKKLKNKVANYEKAVKIIKQKHKLQ
jgi:glycosyltransferase involved in cell wall biosynthesis